MLFCDRRNLAKQRKTICFEGVNHAVNTSKMACFRTVHRGGKLSDNGRKTRVHRQENKRKTSDFTIGKRSECTQNSAFCNVNRSFSKRVNATFFAVSSEQ